MATTDRQHEAIKTIADYIRQLYTHRGFLTDRMKTELDEAVAAFEPAPVDGGMASEDILDVLRTAEVIPLTAASVQALPTKRATVEDVLDALDEYVTEKISHAKREPEWSSADELNKARDNLRSKLGDLS